MPPPDSCFPHYGAGPPGVNGGPRVTHTITLYAFIGYCLLVFAGILALRVLVLVFRPAAD